VAYQHLWLDNSACELPSGKVVCVGRNYAEHAKELNNPVPSAPILFIKPSTAVVSLAEPLAIPVDRGECHHELELALLIGSPLANASPAEAMAAVAGYGLALDLTLRDLQSELKKKGHPWERAKAFDGACPLSAFVSAAELGDWRDFSLKLERNGQVQQDGSCNDMIFAIPDLLAEISASFSLRPGDVVLTGTPAGVGPLRSGDQLQASLGDRGRDVIVVTTSVA
jgi:2-keto-4-pentenoate hydratase/2-oxohepta-3-ene-1,7-dioic acid hydratase in catechol pathway